MAQDWQHDTALPASVHEGLERLCSQLKEASGERLVSVILHGGPARSEYAPKSSDVNVMLVLEVARVEDLDKAISPSSSALTVRPTSRQFLWPTRPAEQTGAAL